MKILIDALRPDLRKVGLMLFFLLFSLLVFQDSHVLSSCGWLQVVTPVDTRGFPLPILFSPLCQQDTWDIPWNLTADVAFYYFISAAIVSFYDLKVKKK